MADRAYFTPTREEIFELQRHLLNIPSGISIEFNTLSCEEVGSDELPTLLEHTMRVEKLVISAAGYAIEGTVRGESGDAKAELKVDITQEPPVAMLKVIADEA